MKSQGPLPSCTVRSPVTNIPPGQGSVLNQEMAARLGCVSHSGLQCLSDLPFSPPAPRFKIPVQKEAGQRPESWLSAGFLIFSPAAQAVSRDGLLSPGIKGVHHLVWPHFGFLRHVLSGKQGLLIRASTICLYLFSPRMITGAPGSLCGCWGSNPGPHAA